MSRRVKTLKKGLALPDGNVYPDVNTIVTLTNAQFDQINPNSFSLGFLEDLGEISDGGVTAAELSTALALKANIASLAPVAMSGVYTDLSGKPEILNHGLETGEEVYSREDLGSSSVTAISQSMRLVYFTAKKSFTTTQVRVIGGSTAAAATPTLIENGLFEINAAGDGTRAAVTANDPGLYSVASSTHTRLWLAPYTLIIGLRYALSWLTVSSFAVPTLTGMNLILAATAEASLSPRINGTIANQTATPTSFLAAAVGSITARPYGVILP